MELLLKLVNENDCNQRQAAIFAVGRMGNICACEILPQET